MTVKIEYPIGGYHWQVKTGYDKEKFKDLKEWFKYQHQENLKFLQTFNLKEGEKIIVSVGGGKKIMTYTGIFCVIGGGHEYGYVLRLQQAKQLKAINGWQVIDILKF